MIVGSNSWNPPVKMDLAYKSYCIPNISMDFNIHGRVGLFKYAHIGMGDEGKFGVVVGLGNSLIN